MLEFAHLVVELYIRLLTVERASHLTVVEEFSHVRTSNFVQPLTRLSALLQSVILVVLRMSFFPFVSSNGLSKRFFLSIP